MEMLPPLLMETDELAALEELNQVMIAALSVKKYILAKREGELADSLSSPESEQAEERTLTEERTRSSYLRTLSYKLRGFLTPILGWSQLLQAKNLDQPITETALASIERNAKLQLKLIEEFLDTINPPQSVPDQADESNHSNATDLDELSQRRLLSEIGQDGVYVAKTLLTDFGLEAPLAMEAARIVHLVYTANRLTA